LNNTLRKAFWLSTTRTAGQAYYVTDENGEKTYSRAFGDDGTISNLKLFAENGGESVSLDDNGNVYIASGQVYVYNSKGEMIDTIEIPERPSQLLFGGAIAVLCSCWRVAPYTRSKPGIEDVERS